MLFRSVEEMGGGELGLDGEGRVVGEEEVEAEGLGPGAGDIGGADFGFGREAEEEGAGVLGGRELEAEGVGVRSEGEGAGRESLEEAAFLEGGLVEGGEAVGVGPGDAKPDGDIGFGDASEPFHQAGAVDADFNDTEAVEGGGLEEGVGDAEAAVEIFVGFADAALGGEDGGDHFLGGGFADAAGDGDDGGSKEEAAPEGGGEEAEDEDGEGVPADDFFAEEAGELAAGGEAEHGSVFVRLGAGGGGGGDALDAEVADDVAVVGVQAGDEAEEGVESGPAGVGIEDAKGLFVGHGGEGGVAEGEGGFDGFDDFVLGAAGPGGGWRLDALGGGADAEVESGGVFDPLAEGALGRGQAEGVVLFGHDLSRLDQIAFGVAVLKADCVHDGGRLSDGGGGDQEEKAKAVFHGWKIPG